MKINNCNHHRQVRFTIKDNHERHGTALRLAMWLFALVLTTDIQQVTCRRVCGCACVRACASGYRPPPHSLAESVFSSSLNLFPFVCCVTELEERERLQYSPSHPTTNHPLNNSLLYVPTHVGNNLHFRTVGMRGGGEDERRGGVVGLLLVGVSSEMVLLCPFCFTRCARLCCNPHNSHSAQQTVFSKCL